MPTIHVNDADFYYELHGSGQPLILVNGYTGASDSWLPLLPALARRFQVLIFDNRGVGRTRDDGRPLTAELMADDVIALSDALGLKKPHVLGASMGGAIAQCIGVRHPEKVNKLVMVVSTAKWRAALVQVMLGFLALREHAIEEELVTDVTLPWLFGEKFLSNPDNIRLVKQLNAEKPNNQSIVDQKRQLEIIKTFDGRAQLSRIQAPTLIVYGKQDIIALPNEAEFLAAQIPNAKLIALDCGHIPEVEMTEALLEAVLGFL